MAEFPALPLWTDAYLGDTTHLTNAEHGSYLLLLMVAWRGQTTDLPDDDRLLAKYARCSAKAWPSMRLTLEPFFRVSDGRWTQLRLLEEKNIVIQRKETAAANGRASALKRKERHSTKRPTERERSDQQNANGQSTPIPITIPKEEGAKAPKPRPAFELPQNVPSEAWSGFEEMRKRKRAPLTDRARIGIVKKLRALAEAGHPPGDVLDQSTRNSWTDVYELKDQQNGQRNRSRSGHGTTVDAALAWIAEGSTDH